MSTDPLARETIDFLETWHRKDGGQQDFSGDVPARVTHFQQRLKAFKLVWNACYTGPPSHRYNPATPVSKARVAETMASTLISLLLTCLPSVPAPNKWTSIFASSDFIGVGVLINRYLTNIFDLAFKPMMFECKTASDPDEDPRLVEGLFFHEVQGKRYLSTKAFLSCPLGQLQCRCWLVLSEHLRRLVYHWLHELHEGRKGCNRPRVCKLLDVRSSAAWAVLQNIAHQLLDPQGRGRTSMLWRSAGCSSYDEWCASLQHEVQTLRRALMALSAWVFRRHVVYWNQAPWTLLMFTDPGADATVLRDIAARWDSVGPCCVRPGLARDLKKQGLTADQLASEPKWVALLSGVADLLSMSIADVECKHALSRHWSERPFPNIIAKHVNRESHTAVQDAQARARHAILEVRKSVSPPPPPALSSAEGKPVVSVKTKHTRSKSALCLFRDEYLHLQQRLQPEARVNPASKDFWVTVKSKWEALSSEQKQYYEELSLQSRQKQQSNRAAEKRNISAQSDSGPVALQQSNPVSVCQAETPSGMLPALSLACSSTACEPVPVAYDPWLLAGEAIRCQDVPALGGSIAAYYRTQQVPSASIDITDDGIAQSPVSEEQLDVVWRANLKAGRTWANTLAQFTTESQRFSCPPAEGRFPDKVTYQCSCGILCRNSSSTRDGLLFCRLLRMFSDAAAASGGGSVPTASKQDILLRIRLEGDEGKEDVYAWMTALSARSGPQAASQVFISCECEQEPVAGPVPAGPEVVLLRLKATGLVQSEISWVSTLLREGPLEHRTEEELAKHLLERCVVARASLVSLTRLSFEDVDLCTVRTNGRWPGWTDLTVEVPANQDDLVPCEPAEFQGGADDDPAPNMPPAPAANPSFNLLDAVLDDVTPRTGRKGRDRGAKATSGRLRQAVVSALPFEPSLRGT